MGGGVLTTGAFIDGERFRLIVDTGSPYLVVPLEEKCAAQSPRLSYYGCASPGRFRAAGFPPTSEQYGALPGRVRWLKGGVRFGDAQPEREYAAVFGAADRAVMSQSGGALLGLIRQVSTQPGSTIPREDLRPTALAQLGVSSFSLDAPRRRLTLSSEPLLGEKEDALQLVDPRPFGDGVEHVCIRVEGDAVAVNGATRVARRPVLCVLDSGLSGCVLSQSLADELGLGGGPLESLEVAVRTESGRRVVLGSSRRQSSLFYAQQIPLNWFSDRSNGPHVVALGQCVLQGGALTVDGATRRATWAPA